MVRPQRPDARSVLELDVQLRPLLRRALLDPGGDFDDLRDAVRTMAFRARRERRSAQATVALLVKLLDEVAPEETPYFNFDQVRERITLWTYTVFRRTSNERK